MDGINNSEESSNPIQETNHVRVVKSTAVQTNLTSVQEQSVLLAHDIIYYAVGRSENKKIGRIEQCLRKCVTDMLQSHKALFNSIMTKLEINDANARDTYMEIANSLFTDITCHWGHVVTLFAFSARLAQYCVENNLNHILLLLPQYLAEFLTENASEFMEKEGGWDDFTNKFDDSITAWKWIAGSVSIIGLAVAFLMTKKQ